MELEVRLITLKKILQQSNCLTSVLKFLTIGLTSSCKKRRNRINLHKNGGCPHGLRRHTMLRGWEQSKGAKLEFDVATSCGLEVWYQYQSNGSKRAIQL